MSRLTEYEIWQAEIRAVSQRKETSPVYRVVMAAVELAVVVLGLGAIVSILVLVMHR